MALCVHSSTFFRLLLFFTFTLLILNGCSGNDTDPLFERLDESKTGISFQNQITVSDTMNSESHAFIYNGAGVASGDVNNDGLVDLFFTGNMVSSRLYINRGNFQFEDITESANIGTTRWATGASMVDINSDGYLDIYVSVSAPGEMPPEGRENLLFINNGDLTFTEKAEQYGINDRGFTTHAAFLDYDIDGDLDLFLLSNSPEEFSRGESGTLPMGGEFKVDPSGYDRLYRNEGDGTFKNVSDEAGIIRKLGYGLGVAVHDLNRDGYPDIYVSNDISPNDVLYINNGDGTFTDRAADWLKHTSFAGMGMDMGDFTNNGWPDILQSDMMPEKLNERKLMSGSNTYGGYVDLRNRGFFPHFNMNTLQMNHGLSEEGDLMVSEISRLAGVTYTHWSWSSLFADFDNDGWKDILITNGYPKALNDFDYLANMHRAGNATSREEFFENRARILEELHGYEIPSHLFRNQKNLTFEDVTTVWGVNEASFSYGAVYTDLDNNGQLDIVVNNINASATVYRNIGDSNVRNWLGVRLKGKQGNVNGIGAKVEIWYKDSYQFLYKNPYRGFMSSMVQPLNFGLGEHESVDSLKVHWPDGRSETIRTIDVNQVISVNHNEAITTPEAPESIEEKTFEEVASGRGIDWSHQSESYVDYNIQPLLPYMISRQGPVMATADVNGDGLEDLFVSGSADQGGSLYLQQEDGRFTETTAPQPWRADAGHRDWGAAFFDANGDGLPDLYLAAGSYQTSPVSPLLQDRLYLNYGGGRFLRDEQALPPMLTATSAVSAADFDGDGDTDLFVGGRLTPRDYPTPARSYLLRNDGGRFTDVTQQMLPSLADPGGMVTDARWSDINGDGDPDLIVAGEWMPIRVFLNRDGAFEEQTESIDAPSRGWWYSLQAADLDGDGDEDLVAGNLGLNHTYTASPESPFGVVAADLTGNRTTDIILTKTLEGTEYPLYGLAKLGRDIYTVGIRYGSFAEFAEQSVEQVAGREAMEQALHYHTDTFASVWLENDGQGAFTMHRLPNLAQIAPVMDIVVEDADGDGHPDLIIAGNLYQSEPTAPRADAGKGLWLRGDGQGGFTPVSPTRSGLLAPGDVKELSLIRTAGGPLLLVGSESESLLVYEIEPSE